MKFNILKTEKNIKFNYNKKIYFLTHQLINNTAKYNYIHNDLIYTFEYCDSIGTVNKLGVSYVYYKDFLLYKRQHNLSLSKLKTNNYILKNFKRVILNLENFNNYHLDSIICFLKEKELKYNKKLENEQTLLNSYFESIEKIDFFLETDLHFNYKHHKIIITYQDEKRRPYITNILLYNSQFCFISDFDNAYNYSRYKKDPLLTSIETISDDILISKITQLIKGSDSTLNNYKNQYKIYYDFSKDSYLIKLDINSNENKNYFCNKIIWLVNKPNKTMEFKVIQYLRGVEIKLLKTIIYDINSFFDNNGLNEAKLKKYIFELFQHISIKYYPTRQALKLIEITDFKDELLDEQCDLIKMMME